MFCFVLFVSKGTIVVVEHSKERRMRTNKRRRSGQTDVEPDSDDEHSLRMAAFAVDGVLPPEFGEARNGIDYLRRVRWEAQQLPSVSVAPAPPAVVSAACPPTHPAVRLCTQSAARGDEWAAHTAGEEQLRSWFRECRARWDTVREAECNKRRRVDAEKLCPVCSGACVEPVELLRTASAVSVSLLLDHLSQHCAEEDTSNSGDCCPETAAESAWMHDGERVADFAKYVFGALCVVERPVVPDDAASLNALCRWCARQHGAHKGDPHAATPLAMLAVLIPTVSCV